MTTTGAWRKGGLVAITLCFLLACTTSTSKPYQCGTPTQDHCYAKALVGDHIVGFLSRIHISTLIAGDGFITNEFWLTNYSGVASWIEVGYKADGRPPHYFWAQRDQTGLFTPHDIADIPEEERDTPVTFAVYQLRPELFAVRIDGSRTHFYTETPVVLWPNWVGGYAELGQELSGTTGASAGLSTFDQNRVMTSGPHWTWLVDPAIQTSVPEGRPPYGSWLVVPSTAAREGGVFSTRCCSGSS